MTKEILNNRIIDLPKEEAEKLENNVRSNLRYSWQRVIAFAISYKPTIQEVIDELEQTFLSFIPVNNIRREDYRTIINHSFKKILGKLFSSEDISNTDIENEFIEIAMIDIRKIIC
ncbi:MAG: hypothetical protein JXA54_03990 [Candidatus Heimdallarchaeota archaeon]|nr:hypothetical protein [Candidatus Heimdallarchaeota archaeon]